MYWRTEEGLEEASVYWKTEEGLEEASGLPLSKTPQLALHLMCLSIKNLPVRTSQSVAG